MKRRQRTLSSQAILVICLVSLLSSSIPTAADAQTLEEGLAAYLDADFRRAETLFQGALRSGELSRSGRSAALIHFAALQMIFGQRERALELTELAVALDPHVQAPEGVDATIAETLDTARSTFENSALHLDIEAETPLISGQQAEISSTLHSPTPSLDVRLDLRCQPPEGPSVQDGSRGRSVALSLHVDDGPLECRSIVRTGEGFIVLRERETFEVEQRRSRRALGLGLGLGIGGTIMVTVVVVLAVVLTGRQVPIDAILVEGW